MASGEVDEVWVGCKADQQGARPIVSVRALLADGYLGIEALDAEDGEACCCLFPDHLLELDWEVREAGEGDGDGGSHLSVSDQLWSFFFSPVKLTNLEVDRNMEFTSKYIGAACDWLASVKAWLGLLATYLLIRRLS